MIDENLIEENKKIPRLILEKELNNFYGDNEGSNEINKMLELGLLE